MIFCDRGFDHVRWCAPVDLIQHRFLGWSRLGARREALPEAVDRLSASTC